MKPITGLLEEPSDSDIVSLVFPFIIQLLGRDYRKRDLESTKSLNTIYDCSRESTLELGEFVSGMMTTDFRDLV